MPLAALNTAVPLLGAFGSAGADSIWVKALKKNLTLAFGSPRFAVAPLATAYVVAAVLIAFVLSTAAELPLIAAVVSGALLGGLCVVISPVMWLIVWGTHRVLHLLRKSREERQALTSRVDKIEKRIDKAK